MDVEHDVRVRRNDRCEVVVDADERVVEGLAFVVVVDRVAVGDRDALCGSMPIMMVIWDCSMSR